MCSDQSQAPLTTCEMCVYPLHLCILKVSDWVSRGLVLGKEADIASFSSDFEVDTIHNKDNHVKGRLALTISREERIQISHEVLHDTLSPFIKEALIACDFVDRSCRHLHYHLVDCNYPASFVEATALVSIKQRKKSPRPFHLCYIPREMLSTTSTYLLGYKKETFNLFQSNTSKALSKIVRAP